MPTKNTIDRLRELLADYEEAIELVEALNEELLDTKNKLLDVSSDAASCEQYIKQLKDEMNEYYQVDLGLDVLYYRLEKGNLLIRQRLEQSLSQINQISNAEILL